MQCKSFIFFLSDIGTAFQPSERATQFTVSPLFVDTFIVKSESGKHNWSLEST